MKRLLLELVAIAAACMLSAAASTTLESGRIRGENGELSLTIAVPLTNEQGTTDGNAWQHMAAALLAVDQFNQKDPTVVKELEQFADCPIQLVNISVVDTGTTGHQAMKSILKSIQQNQGPPDAIAGPYNELPALELSVLATGMESPLVAFRGIDQNLVLPDKHPFYSQINPDLYGEMEFLGDYLQYTNRTDYIAVVYSNEDSILQRLEVLRTVLRKNGVNQTKAFGYKATDKVMEGEDRGVWEAVEKVAKTGFRTIVLLTTTPDIDTRDFGTAAHHYELDRGGHFWVMTGGLDRSSTDKDNVLETYGRTEGGGFLRGMAYLNVFNGHEVNRGTDAFAPSLLKQNASFVQRLRQLNPIPNYFASRFCGLEFTNDAYDQSPFPPDDIFQRLPHVSDYSMFAFDATMAIGIGACLAARENGNRTAMTGEAHLKGIQSSNFLGSSGRVEFQNRPGTPGSRRGNSVYFGVLNLVPPGTELWINPASFLDPLTHTWREISPFVYADGTHSPPLPLRTQPEQNYLTTGVRVFGLTLMSLCLAVIGGSAVWVLVNRHHGVVMAAQPPFLYVLCLGSATTCLVILFSSFDEGTGWTDAMLTKACIVIPWVAALGHIATYSALFTKLWRVNKVLQFKRTRIDARKVAWPALVLILGATAVLAVWTATTDYGWYREEIDDLSGESIGMCTGCHSAAFLVPVGIICVVPTVLTGILAWKTSDVDDLYSESKWIFSLILVQLQVIVVGVPVVFILQDVSPNGRFVGLSLLMSTFPLSTMGLILVPKMVAVRRAKLGLAKANTRGSRSGTRVSGITYDLASTSGAARSNPLEQARVEGPQEQTSSNPKESNRSSLSGTSAPRVQMVTIQ